MALQMEELISHAGFLQNLARSLVLDEHQAQDVSQQAMLSALEKPPAQGQPLGAWLYCVTRNLAARTFRSNKRRSRRERAWAPIDRVPSAQEVTEREEIRRCVVKTLLQLDDPYRSALLLRFYENQSNREAARTLGIPIETLRTHIKRGLNKMRDSLEREFKGSDREWFQAIVPLAGLGSASMLASKSVSVGTVLSTGWLMRCLVAALCIGIIIPLIFLLDGMVDKSPPNQITSPATVVNPLEENFASNRSEAKGGEREEVSPDGTVATAVLSGKVIDSAGRIVEAAKVYVLWEDGTTKTGHRYSVPGLQDTFSNAQLFETDWNGEFTVDYPLADRCYVCLYDAGDPNMLPNPSHEPSWKPWQGRWVKPPATEVDFETEIIAFGTAVITVYDDHSGRYFEKFESTFIRQDSIETIERAAQGSCLVASLPMDADKPTKYEILVNHSGLQQTHRQEYTFTRAGEVVEINVIAGTNVKRIIGVVHDPSGNPIKGALVYSGNQIRMRGDEPFKPFKESRIRDGVRTGTDGRFTLTADQKEVTVWHPLYSPITVAIERTARIKLPPRGTISGRVIDENGNPLIDVEIELDRARKTLTDQKGHFKFDRVEAGIRGLFLPDRRYVGMKVLPGETAQIEIDTGIKEVSIELFANGRPTDDGGEYVFVGLGDRFSMHGTRSEGSPVLVKNVMPGRFLAFTPSGLVAEVEIDGKHATVDFGNSDLTVLAEEGLRIYVVPEGVHEVALLMGGRIGSKGVETSGKVTFDPLPVGRYHVCIDRQGVVGTVEVMGVGTEYTLNNR